MPTREEAWNLVQEYTQSQHLIRHMLAVEVAMRAYARSFGEDEDVWGMVGLVHDLDYERYPDCTIDGHPVVGALILRERGWPEPIIRAMLAGTGHEPVLNRVVLPDHRWYLVLYTRQFLP